MRYEAKHRYFKQIAKVIGNFKNIAKTVAQRHQRYMCYVLSNPLDYLSSEQVLGPVVSCHKSSLEYEAEIIAACPTVDSNSTIQRYYDSVLNCMFVSRFPASSEFLDGTLNFHSIVL